MALQRSLFVTLFALLSIFIYYCGTTTVSEEMIGDTSSLDIVVNNDIGRDVFQDSSTDEISLSDITLTDNTQDTIEDISEEGDIEVSDLENTDVILEDATKDVFVDGGGDGGGKDYGFGDSELTDASVSTFSISGRVTVNGGKPESGKNIYVLLFDKVPNQGVDPIAYSITDNNNEYFIDGLSSGKYYVFAIYDINGDENPDPGNGDPFGYYPNNPVEIKDSSLTNINIDIRTIQSMVSSIYMQRQQSKNAYLISLAAKVIDPKTGEPLSNATVTATDPSNQQVFNLTYNSNTYQYEKQFNPYSQNPVIAREGDYVFTIQHIAYGLQPVKVLIQHKPQTQLVMIISPQNNSTVKIGEDLVVEWKNPSITDSNIMIQMMFREGNQMKEVFKDENQPINNPYVIDGDYFDKQGMYLINVVSGRFVMVQSGLSIEATSGTVIVSAQ